MYGGAKLTLVAMTPVVIFYAIAFTDLALYDPRHLRPHRFYENAGVAGSSSMVSLKIPYPHRPAPFRLVPFQLTQIGGTLNVDGQVVSGTEPYSSPMRHPDLTPVMNDALRFRSKG